MSNRFPVNKQGFLMSFLALAVIGLGAYHYYTKPRTGYIIIQEVHAGFQLKKDLEQKFIQTTAARQQVLDKLALELKFLANKLESQKEKNDNDILLFNNKREEYLHQKQIMEEDNQQLTNNYDREIFSQLNQYVRDYGTEHRYTYIFGSDGNGSLMYAVEAENVTKQVLEYINNKYAGVK